MTPWEANGSGAGLGGRKTGRLGGSPKEGHMGAPEKEGVSGKAEQQSLHSPSGQEASLPLEETDQQWRTMFFIAAGTAEGKNGGVIQPGGPNCIFAGVGGGCLGLALTRKPKSS